MKIRVFRTLSTKFHVSIDGGDPVIKPIAEKMLSKIEKYDDVLCGELAQLAKVVDPRFGSDLLSDSMLLRKYVELPSIGNSSNEESNYGVLRTSGSEFMRELLEKDSMTVDDEAICSFENLQSATNGPIRFYGGSQTKEDTNTLLYLLVTSFLFRRRPWQARRFFLRPIV